jgi:predicted aspartyl protease
VIKTWKLCILLSTGLAAAGANAALADDCPPLTMVTSVEMRIGNDDGRIYVPVKIADKPKDMLVDTGGAFTEITRPTVNELGLSTHHADVELIDIAGQTTNIVTNASLTIGNLRAEGMDFVVMSGNDPLDAANPDEAGVIAPNVLRAYDLDLDFSGMKVNLISQKHCDGNVVYWPADTVAVVPVRVNKDGHIIVPVLLDGHPFEALLDTGASDSIVNLGKATETLGVNPGTPDTPVTGTLGDEAHTQVYGHTFKTLSLEGLTIANPKMTIIPNMIKSKLQDLNDTLSNDTRLNDREESNGLNDVILGMNVIRRLHLYIAYKEQKLYITPAASTPAAAPVGSPH